MGAIRPPRQPSFLLFLHFLNPSYFQLFCDFSLIVCLFVYLCWRTFKQTWCQQCVCVCTTFFFFCSHLSFSSFCPEPEWNHYKKTEKKKKTDQLAILQSLLLRLTGTGLLPATSPLRGGGGGGGRKGAKGGTSLHIKSDFRKTKTQKSTFVTFISVFF